MKNISALSALQLFQFLRYGTMVMAGIGLVKTGLPAGTISVYETFLLYSGLFSFFWVSGFINSLLSKYGKADEMEKHQLLANSFYAMMFTGVLLGLAFITLGFTDLDSRFNTLSEYIILIGIYIALNSPSFIVEHILWLKNRKSDLISYGLVLSFVTLAAVLVPVVMGFSLKYSLVALTILAGVKFLLSFILLIKYKSLLFDFKHINAFILSAMPIALSILISGSSEYIDGLIVKYLFDDVHFTIYRYGAKELPVLLIAANTFSAAMLPGLAGDLNSGLGQLKSQSSRMMHLFFPVSAVLMLISPVIFKVAFSESYIYSALIFNIYLLLAIPRLVFPQTIITATGLTRFLVISSIIEICLNISLSVYLAKSIGLPGIALGTLIAFIADKIFLAIIVKQKTGINPRIYIDFPVFATYSLVLILVFTISLYLMHEGVLA